MKVVYIFILIIAILQMNAIYAGNNERDERKAIELFNSRNFTMGTNPHLQDIFVGRCYAVLGSSLSSVYSFPSSSSVKYINNANIDDPMAVCTELWQLFLDAFAFKNDSNVLPSDFLPFFKHPTIASSLLPPINQALFWSGISDIIPTYQSATNQFVMETSSIIEIVGDLMFCGSPTDPSGLDYESCIWGDYNLTGDGQWHGTWVSYWAAASLAYAPTVSGNITIILRGSPSPFRDNSFFATCELPNLPVSRITGVNVFVVPAENNGYYDTCGNGSMNELVNDLENVGIKSDLISCVNDPPLIQLIECLRTPVSPQCLLNM